jgi:hypothetical protein
LKGHSLDLKRWQKNLGREENRITIEVIAKVRNLPFDKLRVNGLRLKSLTFSVRGELVEPQKNTFAIGSIN